MRIKEKLVEKANAFVEKYKETDPYILMNPTIDGVVKSALTTYNSDYIEPKENKNIRGTIELKDLLKKELSDSRLNNIYFCEKGNVVILHNYSKDCYVEPIHEVFDSARELTYVMCSNKSSFNTFREFVRLNSKYNSFLEDVDEIPNKKTFETLFKINQSKKDKIEVVEKNIEDSYIKEDEVEIDRNYVQLDGNVSKISKAFTKRDGQLARFIEIEQKYEYNNKVKSNSISVMLENDLLKEFDNKVTIGDKVAINGQLNSYIDKNNKLQTSINCYDFEILANNKDIER